MKVLGEIGFDQTVTEIKKLRSKVSELQQIIDNSEIGMGYIDCTYAEALELANNAELNAGYRYRINDYEPCVRESIFVKEVDKENKVKIYPFLTALSKTEFDRNCTFQVETKFQGMVEVSGQYSFDNVIQSNGLDELLMTWVDPKNHKGVITRIDTPIGKIPFDYYNIQMRAPSRYRVVTFGDLIATNRGIVVDVDNKYFAIGLQESGTQSTANLRFYGEWTEPESLSVVTLKSGDKIFLSADNKRSYMSESGIDPKADIDISELVVGTDLAKYYVGTYICSANADNTRMRVSNPKSPDNTNADIAKTYIGDGDYRYFYLPDIVTLPDTLDSLVQIIVPYSNGLNRFVPDKDNKKFTSQYCEIEFHEPLTHDMGVIDAINIKSMSINDPHNNLEIGIATSGGSDRKCIITYKIKNEIVTGTHASFPDGKYFWVYNGHTYFAVCKPDDFIKQSIPANELQPGVLKLNNYYGGSNAVLYTAPQMTITLDHSTKQSVIDTVRESDGTPNTLTIDDRVDQWTSLDPGAQPYGLDLNYPDCAGGQYKVRSDYNAQEYRTEYKLYLPLSTVGYWPCQMTKSRNYLGINLKNLEKYKPESGECEVKLQNGNVVKVFSMDFAYKLHEWLGCESVETLDVTKFDYGMFEMTNIKTSINTFHANLPRNKKWNIVLAKYIPFANTNRYGYTYKSPSGSVYQSESELPSNIDYYCDFSAKFILNIIAKNVDDPEESYTFETDITYDLKRPDID